MERQRNAEAVTAGCFQAGVNLPELAVSQPADQRAMAFLGIGELLSKWLAGNDDVDIERVFGNIGSKSRKVHCYLSSVTYDSNAPRRSTLYTGSAPWRVPGYRTV